MLSSQNNAMAGTEEEDTVSDYQAPLLCADCEGHKSVESFCLSCKADICDFCKIRKLHKLHRILPRTHPDVRKARLTIKQPHKEHPGKE